MTRTEYPASWRAAQILAQWEREERRQIARIYLGAFVICPAAVTALFFLI